MKTEELEGVETADEAEKLESDEIADEEIAKDSSEEAAEAEKLESDEGVETADEEIAEDSSERRERVFAWLRSEAAEEMRTDHKGGGGFSVYSKTRVDTPNGPDDIISWLKGFGFEHDMLIGNDLYRIRHQEPSTRGFPESFTFFLVENPFVVPDFGFDKVVPIKKDDIPY
jgi:hypothetical protein